ADRLAFRHVGGVARVEDPDAAAERRGNGAQRSGKELWICARERVTRERPVALPRKEIQRLVSEEDVVRSSGRGKPYGCIRPRSDLALRIAVEERRRFRVRPARLSDGERGNRGDRDDDGDRRPQPAEIDERGRKECREERQREDQMSRLRRRG